ncbi:hypothetical protein MNBD_GAMMA17-2161 [hydrothermal vent metagenome]|uniref:GTP-binding protein YdgA n=1 Tax=hydrothermal vent metagenome TaxID=652676 RepID=A0A3B0ZWI5_9ZZZZ
MKKALTIGTLLIAGGAIAAAPYMIGANIEEQFRTQFEELATSPQLPPEMQVTLDRYERGYRTATVYTSFSLDMRNAQQNPTPGAPQLPEHLKLTMKHEIEHGPLISGAPSAMTLAKFVSTIELSDEYREIERFYFKDKPFFSATSYLEKDSSSISDMHIPTYQGPSHVGDAEVKWEGFSGTVAGNWNEIAAKMDATAPLLEIAMSGMKLSMKGFTTTSDTAVSPQGLNLGTVVMGIDQIDASGPNPAGSQQSMTLNKLRMYADATQNGPLVNIIQEIGFDNVIVDGDRYENGLIRIEFNNLDATTLENLQQKIQAQVNSLPSDATPELIQSTMLAELQAIVPALLKHSPEIQISKASVTTPQGQIDGRLKFALLPGDSFDPQMGVMALIPLLDIEVDLKLPLSLVTQLAEGMANGQIRAQLTAQEQVMEEAEIIKQSAMMAQQILMQAIEQNFIKKSDDAVSAELRFKKGELLLNGQPSEQLINMLMGTAALASGV